MNKLFIILALSFYGLSGVAQSNHDSSSLFLGIYTSPQIATGHFVLHPEIYYLPYDHLELRASIGYGSGKKQYAANEHYQAKGFFGKIGFAYNGWYLAQSKKTNHRYRVGLEFAGGNVNQTSTYTMTGLFYDDGVFSKDRSTSTMTMIAFVSVSIPISSKWYVDLSPRVYYANVGNKNEDVSPYRFIPGAGTLPQWFDVGIHIGRSLN